LWGVRIGYTARGYQPKCGKLTSTFWGGNYRSPLTPPYPGARPRTPHGLAAPGGKRSSPLTPPCSCSSAIAALGQNTNRILIE